MGFFSNKAAATDQNQKEAYFTASQGQLIRARYKTNRTAMVAGWVLTLMILTGFF
jgi:peptide/nickel transport system permease protein